jgi:hypothetical protein
MPELAVLIHEPHCANLAQLMVPRTSAFAKRNAELSEINMEINDLHRNFLEWSKTQPCSKNADVGTGSF